MHHIGCDAIILSAVQDTVLCDNVLPLWVIPEYGGKPLNTLSLDPLLEAHQPVGIDGRLDIVPWRPLKVAVQPEIVLIGDSGIAQDVAPAGNLYQPGWKQPAVGRYLVGVVNPECGTYPARTPR